MTQKIEDINIKENLQSISVQNMEFRLRKMEESTDQILSHLAVIHRFMSAHIQSTENVQGSLANMSFPIPTSDTRNRTLSENDTSNVLVLPPQPRIKKFNRSLTEVRPDAFIFDEGAHFENRHVLKESDIGESSEQMNDLTTLVRIRKLSVQSEEPEFCHLSPPLSQHGNISIDVPSLDRPSEYIPRSDSMNRRPPTLCVRQDTKETTTSAESRDTLTPLEMMGDDRTITGEGASAEEVDASYEGLRQRVTRRRNSQVGRRNSESQNYEINRSQNSLNFIGNPMQRRQFSLTQSEPDVDGPVVGVPPPKPTVKAGRHLMLQIHAEYTSITDELESMIASPTSSMEEKPKNVNELSNCEFAALIEKKHLKECEDDDYNIMERLLQARCSIDESDENLDVGFASDFGTRRMLRRETAIELPVTPSKKALEATSKSQEYHVRNERIPSISRNMSTENNKLSPLSASNQNSPRNSRNLTSVSYLNPDTEVHQRFYKKSSESLQKNSSSETDYSAHPYRVIKQNSNDTNSSFNIDNSSFTNDLSLEADCSLNSTVIENTAEEREPPRRAQTLSSTEGRPSFLRKQFSIDVKRMDNRHRPQSEHLEFKSTVKTHESSQLHTQVPTKVISNSRLNILEESSSNDSTRDDSRKKIPSISTDLVQDEIAKLSSNIKGSIDERADNDESLNETMC